MFEKSKKFTKAFGLLTEQKYTESLQFLSTEYRYDPGDIYLLHLLVSSYLLLKKHDELINFLNYEEKVSLFGTKLGFIRNLVRKNRNCNLFEVASLLQKRGWREDATVYFRLHSLLNVDCDISLVHLGEDEIRKGNFQKGFSLFNQASKNYFKKV